MKISQIITADKPSLSFEVFPPKSDDKFESVRRAADEIWGAGGYLLYAQELSAKADGVQGMQRLCQALRRADDAIQSYFYDGALREGAAFDDRPEQKEAE